MDVYRISPTVAHCAGAAYAAARRIDEAIKIFCENDYRKFEYEEGRCTCAHVANMSYDIDRPFVIFDDLYIE